MRLRIGRNVADLTAMRDFYEHALGFKTIALIENDAPLAQCLGAQTVKRASLECGVSLLDLTQTFPAHPAPLFHGNETGFQHIAIITNDMTAAHEKIIAHGAIPISADGPQQLPKSSGGVIAFKFRDPEGHPLELLQFPAEKPDGYDHSAISVSNISASVDFYAKFNLRQSAHGINIGRAQDALDALADVNVDVIALSSESATPHLELLHYRSPAPIISPRLSLLSLAADRLIFKAGTAKILHDPDGHAVMLER